MTLKEKFQEWHDAPTNETVAENIIDLEKIADEHAINFGYWICKKADVPIMENMMHTTLSIYKRENEI